MKTTTAVLLTLAVFFLHAEDKPNFATHAFFKHLIGEWTAEGELKNNEGNITTIKQEWKGSITGDGTFTIEGHREINKDKQDFRWTFSPTATGGIYEVSHYTDSNGGNTQRFEASVSEAEQTMELTTPLGDSNLKIHDSFADKDHDTLVSKITITDKDGKPNLTGTITHKRVKKP